MRSSCCFHSSSLPRACAAVAAFVALAPVASVAHADDLAARKAEALKHYNAGLELFDAGVYDGALVEFLKSREIYPTRSALKNAATCLRELKRFDEALDMYEELTSRFGGELPADDKKAVEEDTAKLQKFIGFITIESDVAGATITVDARARGQAPLAKPVRVIVGNHVVKISKDGYAPYETSVAITIGATEIVRGKLGALSTAGKLKIREASGRRATVRLDGGVVGPAPWEGSVAAGTHTVSLEGDEALEAEPRGVKVDVGASVDLALALEPKKGELRVETAAGIVVYVDGKNVGTGSWVGMLKPGKHTVKLEGAGRSAYEEQVEIRSSGTAMVRGEPSAPRQNYIDVVLGFSTVVLAQYQALGDLDHSFETGFGLLLRYGRLIHKKVGVGGFLGGFVVGAGSRYFQATDPSGHAQRLDVNNGGALFPLALGASISYRLLDDVVPLSIGADVGISYMAIEHDSNLTQRGTFSGAAPVVNIDTIWSVQPIFAAELSIGLRVSKTFVPALGVMPFIVFVPQTSTSWSANGWTNLPDSPHWHAKFSGAVLFTLGSHVDF